MAPGVLGKRVAKIQVEGVRIPTFLYNMTYNGLDRTGILYLESLEEARKDSGFWISSKWSLGYNS